MRAFSTLLAAVLLTLCVGLQVLEASGRWDQTFNDASDEAIVVIVVLCVGAALVAARVRRQQFSLSALPQRPVLLHANAEFRCLPLVAWPPFDTSPPVSLRI